MKSKMGSVLNLKPFCHCGWQWVSTLPFSSLADCCHPWAGIPCPHRVCACSLGSAPPPFHRHPTCPCPPLCAVQVLAWMPAGSMAARRTSRKQSRDPVEPGVGCVAASYTPMQDFGWKLPVPRSANVGGSGIRANCNAAASSPSFASRAR